jgi:hypothetical protein
MDTRVYFASRRGFLKGLALGAGGYALGSSLIHLPEAMGQQHSPEQKEVWKMEEASWEFFKQKDLEKYLTLWHKDAEVWGYAAEGPKPKRFYERGYEGKKWFPVPSEKLPGKEISYKLASPSINIHDNIALVFYRCTIEGVDTFPFVARVFHVWEKQGEKWQFIGGMHAKE